MADKYTSGGKTRITIRIDDDILDWFRGEAGTAAGSYQTFINRALREYILNREQSIEAVVRRVVREELSAARSAPTFKGNTSNSRG